jgi:excisionase family DNA binding protein
MLHSVREAATQELRVSPATLWRRIRAGAIPTVRIGRRVLVTDEALRAFIQANERTTATVRPCAPASFAHETHAESPSGG